MPRPHRPCPDSSPVHQREGAALRAREAARGRQFQAGARMPLNPRPEGSGELVARDSREPQPCSPRGLPAPRKMNPEGAESSPLYPWENKRGLGWGIRLTSSRFE